jgi:hypothetical protein
MSRALAYGFGLGLLAAVLAPAFASASWDSYPLSTYPMFARPRGRPLLYFVEGLDGQGAPVRVAPELVATQEVMQAAATVRRAVQGGPRSMERLCERVASRIAETPSERAIVQVRIVGARFDPLRYFSVGPEPEKRTEQLRCDVRRKP